MPEAIDIQPAFIKDSPLSITIYAAHHEVCHNHTNCIELIYCLQGQVNDIASYDHVVIPQNNIHLINPGEIHAIFAEKGNLCVSYHIDINHPAIQEMGIDFANYIGMLYPALEGQHYNRSLIRLQRLLLSILYTYVNEYPADKEVYSHLAQRIMQLLFDDFSVFYRDEELNAAAWNKQRFEEILMYINRNISSKLTLKSIGQEFHLNEGYLSSYFNLNYEDTFSNYLAVLRVYYSERALLSTKRNISDIAFDFGFSDPKFYYRNFKKWYGRTPVQHRQWWRAFNKLHEPNRTYRINEIRYSINQYISFHFANMELSIYGENLGTMSSGTKNTYKGEHLKRVDPNYPHKPKA